MRTGRKGSVVATCTAIACAALGWFCNPANAGYWQPSTNSSEYFYGTATQTSVADVGPNPEDDNVVVPPASQTSTQKMNFVKQAQTDVPYNFTSYHSFSYSWTPTIQNWSAYAYGQAKCIMDAGSAGGTWTTNYASNGAITGDTAKSSANMRLGGVDCGGTAPIIVSIPFTVNSLARAQISNGFTGSAIVTSVSTKTTTGIGEMP